MALKIHDLFDEEDIPDAQSPEYRDFLWETLSDEAREDGHTKSFFLVLKEITGQPAAVLYVSSWSARLEMCQRIRENWTRRAYGTRQEVPA
jgi:hypothetical protein